MNDMINHPNHYTQGIECWDFIVSHKMGYLEGNIIKYVTRYKDKDGLDDLRKAQAYLGRLIEKVSAEYSPEDNLCNCDGALPHYPCSNHTYGISPVEQALEDVRRLNGAIPLPGRVPEGITYGRSLITQVLDDLRTLTENLPSQLDGRNCPQGCDCSDHQCPEKAQARPAFTGDDTVDGVPAPFLGRPWINE